MTKSSSRKKSSKPNSGTQGKRAANQSSSAWVWSNYQGELPQSNEDKVALINLQEKIRTKNRKVQSKASKNKRRESDKTVAQNVQPLLVKAVQENKTAEVFNKRRIFTVGILLLAVFAVLSTYKEKTEKYAVNEHQSKSPVVTAPLSEKHSARNDTTTALDPKATDYLVTAAQKIREVRKTNTDPNLDLALENIRKLSDVKLSDALKSLREAEKTNPSTDLKGLINQVEQLKK